MTAGYDRGERVRPISGALFALLAGLLVGAVFNLLVDEVGPGWYVPLGLTICLIVAINWVRRRPSFFGSVLVVLCVTFLVASAASLALMSGYAMLGVAGLVAALLILLFCGSVLWKIEPAAGWWARLRDWLAERPGSTRSEDPVR